MQRPFFPRRFVAHKPQQTCPNLRNHRPHQRFRLLSCCNTGSAARLQRVSSRWFFPAHKKASAQHIDDDDSDDDETGEGDGDIDGDGDDDHDDNNIDDGSTDDSKDDDGAIWKSFLRRDLFSQTFCVACRPTNLNKLVPTFKNIGPTSVFAFVLGGRSLNSGIVLVFTGAEGLGVLGLLSL